MELDWKGHFVTYKRFVSKCFCYIVNTNIAAKLIQYCIFILRKKASQYIVAIFCNITCLVGCNFSCVIDGVVVLLMLRFRHSCISNGDKLETQGCAWVVQERVTIPADRFRAVGSHQYRAVPDSFKMREFPINQQFIVKTL